MVLIGVGFGDGGIWKGRVWRWSNKRECVIIGDDGDEEWKVLKAVEAVTMGAGVLPAAMEAAEGNEAGGSDYG